MNPYDGENSIPNFWLSCLTINPEAMAEQIRSDSKALYKSENGKSSPTEILEALAKINAEGRPIWKPMHSQPIFRMNPFVTVDGYARANSNAYIEGSKTDVVSDIFERGLCLPSDNKMSEEEQEIIIKTIIDCFK